MAGVFFPFWTIYAHGTMKRLAPTDSAATKKEARKASPCKMWLCGEQGSILKDFLQRIRNIIYRGENLTKRVLRMGDRRNGRDGRHSRKQTAQFG